VPKMLDDSHPDLEAAEYSLVNASRPIEANMGHASLQTSIMI
jgi:hypothetical protein